MTILPPAARTDYPLAKRLPPEGETLSADELLDRFLDYVKERGVELYPAQEEAVIALFEGQSAILNTPTGSGKSLVATALHFLAAGQGRRSYYTCPIKALVNEKFLGLCQDFGPELVGMATGDATVNRDAPIMCCTAEILANMALREGASAPVEDVVMDEFHYYADRERGVAWQIPLLTLPYVRFLLMSATLGETEVFEKALEKLTGRKAAVIRSTDRPVPLDFVYQETPLHQTVHALVTGGKAPVYLVSFTQRECAETAQSLMSFDFSSKSEKRAIAEALIGVKFSSPYGKELSRFVRHGIGLHHAGLLPKYRLLVEKLAQQGLLKVVCGTDTLGVGVNIPIRTVLLTKLCKYDGAKTGVLSVRDFHQISGRAGRKGFDDRGTVVVQAPEHVIENLMLEAKAGGDPKKLRKIVRRKPPERGYVHYDVNTFNRLTTSACEPLTSRFTVSHGQLLNVLSRPGDGCHAMRQLLRDCHESDTVKRNLRKTAFQMFRSLVERGIIEIRPDGKDGPKLRVNMSLQDDFSLNQTLSLYLLDTLKLLDAESEDYALDALTLVESILENPELILRQQLSRLKTTRIGELKAAGVEYEERMAELETLEYPKPNREFIYDTFNRFAAAHPWVGQENIRPKSIAREMYETFQTFDEYVREYDLHRAEGLLLRYLSEVYKVLMQTVPADSRTEEVLAIMAYFGGVIRGVDSSLIDEWEALRRSGRGDISNGAQASFGTPEMAEEDVTKDQRAFVVMIRNEAFRFVRALAARDWGAALAVVGIQPAAEEAGTDAAAAAVDGEDVWKPEALEALLAPYFAEHAALLTDRKARHPANTRIRHATDGATWAVRQTLVDPAGNGDYYIDFVVDLARSRAERRPVLRFSGVGDG